MVTTQNVIYVPTLIGEYKTGLIFSLIEGLKAGQSLKLVCDEKPDEFQSMLKDSGLSNINWNAKKNADNTWELFLSKEVDLNSTQVGCCGMCGGHSAAKG